MAESIHDDPTTPHWFSRTPSEVSCGECGGECCEFTIPSDVWNAVVRAKGYSDYLCVGCYHEAVTRHIRAMQPQAKGSGRATTLQQESPHA